MNTMNINTQGLLNILNQQEKSTFINLTTEIVVKMNKTNNPYYNQVKKQSKCNYLIGNSYEDRWGSNGEREGFDTTTFVVDENKVGKHISKCVLFNERLNKYYLQVERFDEIKPQVEYTFEGNTIDKVLFESFMVKVSQSNKQPQQRKVKFISFGFDSIKEITLNGTRYIIE